MRGVIIVNAFGVPEQSVKQAQRLKEEFSALGCAADIIQKRVTGIFKDNFYFSFGAADFIVYLDKDKYLSETLEKSGARLFNSHAAVRVCDDKARTCIALSENGIAVPDTVFAPVCYKNASPDKEFLSAVGEKLGFPVVVKESYGSMGNGVYLARDLNELVSIEDALLLKPHVFQKYLSKEKGTDIRVIVIGGNAVSAIKRKNDNDFRSNVAAGGKGTSVILSAAQKQIAEKSAAVLGLDYCGVDILIGDSGEPVVCEVNSNAFFEESERVTGLNIAGIYAEYIIKTVKS